jgi:hypothetical protein
MATPFIFMKRTALRGVAAGQIIAKIKGDLRQCSVVACCLPHHVAMEEANTAANNAFRYPICGNRHLLPPLNLNLHLPKAHHHILGHHLTAIAVLLTRAAPVTHIRPNDLHHNTGWMKRTRHFRDRCRRGNHFRRCDNICRHRGTLLQCLCHWRGCTINCP